VQPHQGIFAAMDPHVPLAKTSVMVTILEDSAQFLDLETDLVVLELFWESELLEKLAKAQLMLQRMLMPNRVFLPSIKNWLIVIIFFYNKILIF
jgi:hypothetical protein